jgi:hypothetical protein
MGRPVKADRALRFRPGPSTPVSLIDQAIDLAGNSLAIRRPYRRGIHNTAT